MSDKNTMNIDKKDKKIIHELEKNSRENFKTIGKRIGLSGEVVDYRVKNLQKYGIITRMFAEPNLNKLGLKTYRVYLKIENMGDENTNALLEYIATCPKVQWYGQFEGEWDYTIRYAMKDELEFKEEIDRLLSMFGKFIKAKDVVITTSQAYLPITYLTGGERIVREVISGKVGEEKIDEIDKKILFHLCEDSRTRSVDISSKIKISPDAVQYRIKKLIKNGIIAFFTMWLDRRKFGYEHYKVLLWFQYATKKDEKKLIGYCEQHPNVVYINRVIGNWDLEIDFDAKNSKEIHDLVKNLKNKFPGIIRDHTTLAILSDQILNPFRK